MGQRHALWDKSVSTNQGTAAGALISGVKDKLTGTECLGLAALPVAFLPGSSP